jgi:uncharacterized Tic20 family protein
MPSRASCFNGRMSETTPSTVPPLSDHDEKLWATLIHLGGIFLHFLPALVGFTVLKDRGAFIRLETRSALNFQFTVLLAYLAGIVSAWFVVGLILIAAAGILNLVFSIIAAVAANRGEHFDYPLSIPFIRV